MDEQLIRQNECDRAGLLLDWLELLLNGRVKADGCWSIVLNKTTKEAAPNPYNPCTNTTGTVRESGEYADLIRHINKELGYMLLVEQPPTQ